MKNNCNITKDLLPLYIEDLCSEDSREYVDAHLKECSECMKTYEYLKYTDLCISATEKREINGFKKLERYISGRILINYFLFLVAIVLGIVILLFTTNRASYGVYFLLMPLTMLATGFTFSNNPFNSRSTKKLNICLVIQGILIPYTIGLMFYAFYTLYLGAHPFGIPPYNLGPLMSAQFKITISVSLFFLISYLYQVGRKKVQYSVWWNMSILCIFLNLTYDSTLYTLSTWEAVIKALMKNTAILFGISIVTTLFIWLVTGRKQNKLKAQ